MARELSDDVRWVGDTLGTVLRAQAGEACFDAVEGMRLAAKRARESELRSEREEAREELARRAGEADPERARDVAHAFALYFQLVNTAEDVHRVRELRRRERERGPAGVEESLAAVLAELCDRGATFDEIREELGRLDVRFVFTAHPTEARRRTTERLLAEVREVIGARDRTRWTPGEEREGERHLRALVEALWQHGPERTEPPEVLDEVHAGLWYVENVLLDTVPRLHRQLRAACEAAYGEKAAGDLPLPISFGSWMGSDRDGHPYVTDDTTERTLALHREIALSRYLRDLDALVDPLAAEAARLPTHAALEAALAEAGAELPEAREETRRRNPREPLRRMLGFVRERLERARLGDPGGYSGPEDLLRDLEVVEDVLRRSGASALADGALRDLVVRVRVFGFHLAALHVREDARVVQDAVAELRGDGGAAADPEARVAQLAELELPEREEVLSDETRRLLSLFRSLRRQQAAFGEAALSTFVVSHCDAAADLLAVFRLAELHDLAGRLDLVPLLESRASLEAAEPLLERIFAHAPYREHLRRRGDVQTALVGYSDSMKESGVLASRVAVRHALRRAERACRRHGVRCRPFHGRGGSVSRGGGPTYRAIQALPGDAFAGELEITEQGEGRALHFGHPDLALRYLEQTVGAALLRRHEVRSGEADDPVDGEEGGALLSALADAGARVYRQRVEDDATLRFFEQCTPFPVIAELNIASRPASRADGSLDLDSLRAIPWVFAWSQCRLVLTGWYGVGAALEALAAERGEEPLRRLHEGSRFYRDLLDNVQMTLAKADPAIARRYGRLGTDPEASRRFLDEATEEFRRTRAGILAASGQAALLDEDPVLQRSIALRNPYVDPLSYLQVEALARRRDGSRDDAWDRVARITVQGIAAGLRNTG